MTPVQGKSYATPHRIPGLIRKESSIFRGKRPTHLCKTDPGATFMRMKDDHMQNGELKPGFNVQIGTQKQFVVGFSIHQNATDTSCLKEHLEGVKKTWGTMPQKIVADAGYGSEENYEYLKEQSVEGYVKYNNFILSKSVNLKEAIQIGFRRRYDI